MEGLEIVSAIVTTASNESILFSSCYRPPDAECMWMEKFNKFLDYACDQFNNIVISGDFNLPSISWDLTLNTSGADEINFVDILNDHFLTSINTMPTRANKTLDLVVTSVLELVTVSEILSPEKSELITDHCTILYEFSEHVKARRRIERFVYNYSAGDFEGLRKALHELDLTTLVERTNDINIAREDWKNAFTTIVSHYIPKRIIKGRNPAPWIDGSILTAIRKKESAPKKMKSSTISTPLRQQFKIFHSKVKYMLREGRKNSLHP